MKWIIGIVSALGISVLSIGLALLFVGSDSSIAGPDENVSASNGLSTAINVHGDWSIDVINPDGTLAEHREFTNQFVGQTELVNLLTGKMVAGGWRIALDSTLDNGTYKLYQIVEEDDPQNLSSNLEKNLTILGGDSLQLNGSFTGTVNYSIGVVSAYLGECEGNAAGVNCYKNFEQFSRKPIAPIDVLADQQVNASVLYTFGN